MEQANDWQQIAERIVIDNVVGDSVVIDQATDACLEAMQVVEDEYEENRVTSRVERELARRSLQAERQRDEALALLRDADKPMAGHRTEEWWDRRADILATEKGTDHDS